MDSRLVCVVAGVVLVLVAVSFSWPAATAESSFSITSVNCKNPRAAHETVSGLVYQEACFEVVNLAKESKNFLLEADFKNIVSANDDVDIIAVGIFSNVSKKVKTYAWQPVFNASQNKTINVRYPTTTAKTVEEFLTTEFKPRQNGAVLFNLGANQYTAQEVSHSFWRLGEFHIPAGGTQTFYLKFKRTTSSSLLNAKNLKYDINVRADGKVTTLDPWWNVSFDFRLPITVTPHVTVNNAAFLIQLNSTVVNLSRFGSLDGADFRFTDSASTTEYDYFIENANTSSDSFSNIFVWVKIPTAVKDTAQDINFYYGNVSPVEPHSDCDATFHACINFEDTSGWSGNVSFSGVDNTANFSESYLNTTEGVVSNSISQINLGDPIGSNYTQVVFRWYMHNISSKAFARAQFDDLSPGSKIHWNRSVDNDCVFVGQTSVNSVTTCFSESTGGEDRAQNLSGTLMDRWYRQLLTFNESAGNTIQVWNQDNTYNMTSTNATPVQTRTVNNFSIGSGDVSAGVEMHLQFVAITNLTSADFSFGTEQVDAITAVSPTNQTYTTGVLDFNVTVDFSSITNSPIDDVTYSLDGATNVSMSNDTATNWFEHSGSHAALSQGAHNISFFAEAVDGEDSVLDLYFTYAVAGLNITFHSGNDDSKLTDVNIEIRNDTTSVTHFNVDDIVFDYTAIPTGLVDIIIFKDNYLNTTYTDALTITSTSMQNFTAYPIQDETTNYGLINVTTPNNGSSYIGATTPLNVTIPVYASGAVNLSYTLGNGARVVVCRECRGGAASLPITDSSEVLNVTAESAIYGSEKNAVFYLHTYANYNLTLFDEMTEDYFNVQADLINETRFTIYCPTKTDTYTLNSSNTSINITCVFDQLEVRNIWNNAAGEVYRTLIPSATTGEVRFYLVDTDNYTSNLQQIYLDDASGLYRNARARVTKILSNGSHVMIEQNVGAAADVFVHLILNEQYILSFLADGLPTRTIGVLRGTADASLIVKIASLEIIPSANFQLKDVGWAFRPNGSASTIQLVYNDTLNATTSINFTIYNASQLTQVIATSTVVPGSKVTTITLAVPDNETTYQATFVAQHSILGVIEDSFTITFFRRIVTLPGLPEKWYQIIGLAFIVLLAFIFGSYHAGAGALVVSLGGGVMYFFGFIDSVVGIGVIMLVILLAGLAVIGNRRNE